MNLYVAKTAIIIELCHVLPTGKCDLILVFAIAAQFMPDAAIRVQFLAVADEEHMPRRSVQTDAGVPRKLHSEIVEPDAFAARFDFCRFGAPMSQRCGNSRNEHMILPPD